MYTTVDGIRFFCVVGPPRESDPLWWPDVSHRYLVALREAGMPVRAIALNGTHLTAGPGQARDDLAHWERLHDAFVAQVHGRINVVCAPPAMLMGQTSAAFGNYQPEPALLGLWTLGMVNVAITRCVEGEELGELEALQLNRGYDLVVTPTASARLAAVVPEVEVIEAAAFPARIRALSP